MRIQAFFATVVLACYSVASLAETRVSSGPNRIPVVELYTSEGCSSCPPADKYLSNLGKKRNGDVIPLAFHVDYWNYIGWVDPYSQAKFTERQHHAGVANQQSTIYTPEFLVDGVEARGTSSINTKIDIALESRSLVDLTLEIKSLQKNRLKSIVTIDSLSYQGPETPEVFVVIYENNLANSIDAGENRGRTLKHDFVVRHLSESRAVLAGGRYSFDIAIPDDWKIEDLGISAIVRLQNSGKTLQAVKLDHLS